MTLAYDAEDGAGPPVVCLPMFGTTRAVTRAALAPALAGSGRRTLWVDLPGHGDSPPAGAPTSEDVLAEVLAFLAEHDDGGGVMLAGCSYGGYLAAAVARRRPEVVRGMLLVCAGVRTSDRDLPPPREDAGPAGWLDGVAPQYRDHLGVALGGSDPAVAKTVSDLLVGGTGGDEAWRDLLHGDRFPLRDEAEVVPYAGPVSVVAGREDRVVGYADQYRLMAAYPGGTYAALAGAGHYLPFERPAMLRALAQEWLARCVT